MVEITKDTNIVISDASGVENINIEKIATKNVYNMQGILIIKNANAEDINTLPAGLYIIDGKKISAEIRAEIAEEVKTMKESGVCPGLAVIIVGEDPASKVYVRNKGRACAEVGIYSEIIEMPVETTEAETVETEAAE